MTRGDIYLMDFGIPFGSEPGYQRPVIIAQSNKDNLNKLNTTIVIPLTSNTVHAETSGNVFIRSADSGLTKDSVALIHQIVVVDKERLIKKISAINKDIMKLIEAAEDYVLK